MEQLIATTHQETQLKYPDYSRDLTSQIEQVLLDAVDIDDFIIPFDLAWVWAGYSRKDAAKRVLLRELQENTEYKIWFLRNVEPSLRGKHGGDHKLCLSLRISKLTGSHRELL
jgi:hypothetical protein